MKIFKSQLQQIIKEEVDNYVQSEEQDHGSKIGQAYQRNLKISGMSKDKFDSKVLYLLMQKVQPKIVFDVLAEISRVDRPIDDPRARHGGLDF